MRRQSCKMAVQYTVGSYVASELELILLVLGGLNVDTRPHGDPSYELLADEVPDLNLKLVGLLVLLDVDVDGKMGIDVAHPTTRLVRSRHCLTCNILVLVALGDTDDQVVLRPVSFALPHKNCSATYNESSDSAEGSDTLARTVVELDLDDILLWLFECLAGRPISASISNIRARS